MTSLDIKPHININPINNQVRKRYQVAICSMMIFCLAPLPEQDLSRSKLNNTQAGIVSEKQNMIKYKKLNFGGFFHNILDRNKAKIQIHIPMSMMMTIAITTISIIITTAQTSYLVIIMIMTIIINFIITIGVTVPPVDWHTVILLAVSV